MGCMWMLALMPIMCFYKFDPNGQENVHDMSGEIVAVGQYEFNFKVPAEHPQGTYWYHPHKHGATDLQVANGMAGAIIVQDTSNTFQDYAEQVLIIQRISDTLPGAPTLGRYY